MSHNDATMMRRVPVMKAWTPFQRAEVEDRPTDPSEIETMAERFNMTREAVAAVMEDVKNDVTFLNSRYQVAMRRVPPREGNTWPEMIQLGIKRLDKERVGEERYRDFLRIKNELVGPEHEALEIYPAMERNVDTANQYYVWVFTDPTVRLPFGFQQGKMIDDTSGTNAKQHPFDAGDIEHMTVATYFDTEPEKERE